MSPQDSRKDPFQLKTTVAASLVTLLSLSSGMAAANVSTDDQASKGRPKTATPIKHVIVLIGENRTFDNVYGTYIPKRGQSVSNLLSKKIVDADGAPGPNKDLAKQYEINGINPASYFISAKGMNKAAYDPFLPTPGVNYAPPQPMTLDQLKNDAANGFPPFDAKTFTADQLHTIAPGIAQSDVELLTTGATGLKNCTTDPTKT
ncbi:MAG: hypothetical protein PHE55_09035, partial [Methylococcaceae bacterium]|nr:hypothetical protein [Methylococcaceae bacterium]